MSTTSLGQKGKRAILERGRLGRAFESRLLVAAAGGRPGGLDVIDVGRHGLQRAPARAGDVRQVGRRSVGSRDGLADPLGVPYRATAVRRVAARLGQRDELGDEALELGGTHPLADQAP